MRSSARYNAEISGIRRIAKTTMLGGDLTNPRAITAKGLLLLLCAAIAAIAILLESPSWRMAGLVAILVWATARSYFFLFYVLHRYVDPRLRYDGILGLLRAIRSKAPADAPSDARNDE